jgi:DNA polymerase-3 subunit epsilon
MSPKTLLIIDLETTGIDPQNYEVIELGAILYSVPNQCVLQQLSTLFPVGENKAEMVNRISSQASQEVQNFELALQQFQKWVEIADFLVAHNASFDSQWFGLGVLPAINKPWLCTYNDFIWEKNHKPTNLVQTALNHGVGVNQAHRALTDCQLIAAIFDRIVSDHECFENILEKAIERSKEPMVTVIARVNYDERQLAKDYKFRWNPNNKQWQKEIKRCDFLEESNEYLFEFYIEEC